MRREEFPWRASRLPLLVTLVLCHLFPRTLTLGHGWLRHLFLLARGLGRGSLRHLFPRTLVLGRGWLRRVGHRVGRGSLRHLFLRTLVPGLGWLRRGLGERRFRLRRGLRRSRGMTWRCRWRRLAWVRR